MRLPRWALALAVLFALAAPASAVPISSTYGPFAVTFYNSGDTDGAHSSTGNWSAEQMASVGAGVAAWDSFITNTPIGPIRLHMFWNELPDNVLGQAASIMATDGTHLWTMPELKWRERIDVDFGYSYDTFIEYDITAAGFAWNYGSGNPTGAQLDFRSVVTHELGHSLGWTSGYSSSSDAFTYVSTWDSFLRDSAGNRPAQGALGGDPGNFNQLDNPVYFVGPNAVAANGGNPVPVYAPATWAAGSSLGHLDENTYPLLLMGPSIGLGQVARTPSSVEIAMMTDMGWSTTPEPATIICMGAGWVLIRRRRRKA